MSDSTLNKFITYGTNADRLAFTPSPPAGVNILYEWRETDTGNTYVFDTAWHLLTALAQMPALTIKGNNTGSLADALDLTATQATAMFSVFVGDSGLGGTKGLVPAPAAGDAAAGKFLAASGGFAPGIRVVTIPITNAQIKTLPTTPVTLVAAPGVGFVIEPIWMSLYVNTTAGAYTNIDANGFLFAQLTSSFPLTSFTPNDAAITNGSATRLTDLLGTTTPRSVRALPFFDTEGVDLWGMVPIVVQNSAIANLPMVLTANNGVGNFTGGNAANSAIVTVAYLVVAVP